MIVFPHAKINLGLNVVRRRQDGYHDLESVFVPVPLHDVLEAVVDAELPANAIVYTRSGLPIPGAEHADLCHKAVRLLQALHPLPGIRLHLHKVIPMGAGLGGGSSDGAHTLLLLDRLCGLGLSSATLDAMATELGSDCSFFLRSGTQLAQGRGELLAHFPLDLSGLWLVLIAAGVHVPTPEVFRHTRPTEQHWEFGTMLDRARILAWQNTVINTMEPYVLEKFPAVASAKRRLIESGAVYASMSGSGSSVFGLFTAPPPRIDPPAGSTIWTFPL